MSPAIPLYFGTAEQYRHRDHPVSPSTEMMRDMMAGLAVFTGIGMAIGSITWLIRTFVDYRRYRPPKCRPTYTKLLDRFTGNDELLAYAVTPLSSNLLHHARSLPRGRLARPWAASSGLCKVGSSRRQHRLYCQLPAIPVKPKGALSGLGILGIALGLGFVVSALSLFAISKRLGIIDLDRHTTADPHGAQQG